MLKDSFPLHYRFYLTYDLFIISLFSFLHVCTQQRPGAAAGRLPPRRGVRRGHVSSLLFTCCECCRDVQLDPCSYCCCLNPVVLLRPVIICSQHIVFWYVLLTHYFLLHTYYRRRSYMSRAAESKSEHGYVSPAVPGATIGGSSHGLESKKSYTSI